MSESGRKTLQQVLDSIDKMSDEELIEIFDVAEKRAKEYEKSLAKLNGYYEDDIEVHQCPFCGSKAEIVEDNGVYLVECLGCRAASGRNPYAKKAAKMWNRRIGEYENQ